MLSDFFCEKSYKSLLTELSEAFLIENKQQTASFIKNIFKKSSIIT
jgi:hypothetical protein